MLEFYTAALSGGMIFVLTIETDMETRRSETPHFLLYLSSFLFSISLLKLFFYGKKNCLENLLIENIYFS